MRSCQPLDGLNSTFVDFNLSTIFPDSIFVLDSVFVRSELSVSYAPPCTGQLSVACRVARLFFRLSTSIILPVGPGLPSRGGGGFHLYPAAEGTVLPPPEASRSGGHPQGCFAPPSGPPPQAEAPGGGGAGARAQKIEPVRADAQWIVATRLLYHVHDPTGRPSRLQGI